MILVEHIVLNREIKKFDKELLGKRSFGRPRRRREGNIKTNRREIGLRKKDG
jgi:hypothetical protein